MRTFQPRHVKKILEIPQEGSAKSAKSPESTPFGTFGTEVLAHSAKKILEARDMMQERNQDVLMGFLEGQNTSKANQTLELLPQDLHALVRAASSGVLPHGTAKLETGISTDFERFVLGYAAQILTGDRQHALENLYVALRFWQGSLSSLN